MIPNSRMYLQNTNDCVACETAPATVQDTYTVASNKPLLFSCHKSACFRQTRHPASSFSTICTYPFAQASMRRKKSRPGPKNSPRQCHQRFVGIACQSANKQLGSFFASCHLYLFALHCPFHFARLTTTFLSSERITLSDLRLPTYTHLIDDQFLVSSNEAFIHILPGGIPACRCACACIGIWNRITGSFEA